MATVTVVVHTITTLLRVTGVQSSAYTWRSTWTELSVWMKLSKVLAKVYSSHGTSDLTPTRQVLPISPIKTLRCHPHWSLTVETAGGGVSSFWEALNAHCCSYLLCFNTMCHLFSDFSLFHYLIRHHFLVCDLNRTPNCYGKTWRFLCPFFRNLHLRENLARACFTSTVSTVTNSVQISLPI